MSEHEHNLNQSERITTNIHLFFACKICQYLTLNDLLNYCCAVRPDGIANQIRDRIRPRREALNRLCNEVSNFPVIGRPTSAVTTAVVHKATSLVEPFVKAAVSKVPSDQILLWSLATARCVSNFLDNSTPPTSNTRSMTTYDYSLRRCENSSLKYAEYRVALIIEELKEGIASLARLFGMDILIRILPSIAAIGGGNRFPVTLISDMFINKKSIEQPQEQILTLPVPPPTPVPMNEDERRESLDEVSSLVSWTPLPRVKRAVVGAVRHLTPGGFIALYDYLAPTDLPRRERTDSIATQAEETAGGQTPCGSPPYTQGGGGTSPYGGRPKCSDERSESLLSDDDDSIHQNNNTKKNNLIKKQMNIRNEKLSKNLSYKNLLEHNQNNNDPITPGITMFQKENKNNREIDQQCMDKLSKEFEKQIEIEQIEYEKAVADWLSEVAKLNHCDGMSTITGYRELIPNGLIFGDLTCFQNDVKLHKNYHSHSAQHNDLKPHSKHKEVNSDENSDKVLKNEIINRSEPINREQEELPAPVSPRSLRRMQRMMHYEVSLAPFQVTLILKPEKMKPIKQNQLNPLKNATNQNDIQKTNQFDEDNQDDFEEFYVEDLEDEEDDNHLRSSAVSTSSSSPGLPSPKRITHQKTHIVTSTSLTPPPSSLSTNLKKKHIKTNFKSSLSENDLNQYSSSQKEETNHSILTDKKKKRRKKGKLLKSVSTSSIVPIASSVKNEKTSDIKVAQNPNSRNPTDTLVSSSPLAAAGAVPCTPHSFPPSPSFRADIMARGSLAADDTIFAARDQLRRALQVLHFDPNVRAVAEYLDRRNATAIFNAHDCSKLLLLSRGGHCVSYNEKVLLKYQQRHRQKQQLLFQQHQDEIKRVKNKHDLTSISPPDVDTSSNTFSGNEFARTGSVRAMIPVLHNRYVCFQYTLYQEFSEQNLNQNSESPPRHKQLRSKLDDMHHAHHVTVGLSTSDMPYDDLLGCGSFIHSIGISGNGDLLMNGNAIHRMFNKKTIHYGHGSTVSLVVYRDNDRCYNSNHEEERVSCSKVWISIYVDGKSIIPEYDLDQWTTLIGGNEMIEMIVPRDLVLFPTVTFRSFEWRVNGYFSAADMISEYRKDSSSDLIGACEVGCVLPAAANSVPPASVVYALDGSVVRYPDTQSLS